VFAATEESFYQTFYSLVTSFDKRERNRAKLLTTLYAYTDSVSRPFNSSSKSHLLNNASILKAEIQKMIARNASHLLAKQRNAATGRTVSYSFQYPEYETSGDFFQYDHSGYEDPCLLHSISLKMVGDCGDSVLLQTPKNRKLIRQLLVVAVQRSGLAHSLTHTAPLL